MRSHPRAPRIAKSTCLVGCVLLLMLYASMIWVRAYRVSNEWAVCVGYGRLILTRTWPVYWHGWRIEARSAARTDWWVEHCDEWYPERAEGWLSIPLWMLLLP